MAEVDCVFCKIVAGEIPSEKEYEDDDVLVFYDIKPSAELHLIIIPKRHIETFTHIKEDGKDVLMSMVKAAQKLVKEKELKGYKIVFNGGYYQVVPHLHMHLLGGKMKGEAA